MKVVLEESVDFPVAPGMVWDVLTDIENMRTFVGFGPIPGIASARWTSGDGCRVGAVRAVENTDGSKHFEDVVAAVPGERLEDRIYDFSSPFRFLIREVRDRFELAPKGNGTELGRTFALELKSPLVWPLVYAIIPLFRRALRRHHEALRKKLEE
jgi:hypothetical protein